MDKEKGVDDMKLTLQFRIGDSCLNSGDSWDQEKVASHLMQALVVPEKTAPQDLDLLSLKAACFNGQEEKSFEQQKKSLYETSRNSGFLVENSWLEYISAVPEEKLEELTEAWCQEIREMFMEDLTADDALKGFVKQLRGLCQEALAQSKPLVYLWSLQ